MTRVRAACHVHSTWSYDGKWSLTEIVTEFSRRGYNAVMLTEHDQGFDENRRLAYREACRAASTNQLLLLPGLEYSDSSNTVHLLVWGDIPFLGNGIAPERTLTLVDKHMGAAVLAHPSRKNAWTQFNPTWSEHLVGIEAWNRKTDGWAPSRNAWELIESSRVLPFVGMDFHTARQLFPMTTVVEIDSPLCEESMVRALRSKCCSSEVFGRPIQSFKQGITPQALYGAESARRVARLVYRKFVP